MVTHAVASKQVTRLAQHGKSFTDMRDEGIEELVQALKLACLNARHAERVIDTWTRLNRWMPTVADIYETAEAVQDRPDPPESRFQCPKCCGSGWQQAWTLATRREGSKDYEITRIAEGVFDQLRLQVDGDAQRVDVGAVGCDCDYGCQLANARWVQKQKEMADQAEQPKSKGKLGAI